jgi:DNA-binding transcriptional MerR regulator
MATKDLEVLKLQEQGLSIEDIAKKLDYTNIDSLAKYMNKRGYSKKNGKFILKEGKQMVIEQIQTIENTELKEIKEQLKSINLWAFEQSCKKDLVVEPKQLDLKGYSIRADKGALELFDKVAEKYSNVSKSYLFSKALEEFAEKYL